MLLWKEQAEPWGFAPRRDFNKKPTVGKCGDVEFFGVDGLRFAYLADASFL